MKRLLILLCVVGILAVFPLSHSAFAGKGPAPKVSICHVTGSVDIEANQWTLVVGHVITVSENAVDAHVAHGDTLQINDIDGPSIFNLTWRQVAENLGLSTAGADCAGFILD